MSNLERHLLRSSKGVTMSSEEMDSCVEECRGFVQKSKNLGHCPEEILEAPNKEVMSESLVDYLTEKELDNVREKLFKYWETTDTQPEPGRAGETSRVGRLQDCGPTTQSEEAVISFEDAKSEVAPIAKRLVQRYDFLQLIEAELKEIRKSKLSRDDGCASTKTQEAKLPNIESMDFTELQKKADLPRTAAKELTRETKLLPVPRRTDVLEVLLRIYEISSVDSVERAATYLAVSETGDFQTGRTKKVQEFRKRLAVEIKVIYERLISTYPLETHRAPENIETSNSSSSGSRTKDSSSSKITSPFIPPVSPLELSTSAYPELTTRSLAVARDDDDTISSLPFTTLDSNTGSSASGLINEPVIDMAAAQPKSSTSSTGDSAGNKTTISSTADSEEEDNTLSEISSLATDTRASVSSSRNVDPRRSVSSSRNVSARTSLSSSRDVFPRTSVSSLRDADQRTSVSDVESLAAVMSPIVLQQNLLSEDEASDDAFLTAPLVATKIPLASALPSAMDSAETVQKPRRRGRSSKGDEDKKEAKRPAP